MSNTLALSLYNTLTRKIENFTALTPNKVGVYCCGPTVYDYQHIGNFKTFLFEDILVRVLRYSGYDVKHVMNITDVGHLVGDGDSGEDKMLVAARREKKKSLEIAEYYTVKFFEDWDKLNLSRPTIVCKATDHIADMISLIERIQAHGYAYIAGGNVYFDSSKCPDYGKLARLKLEGQKAGARVEVDANKRNPFDFVLWFTKSKFENQELQWDSPWGRGYPGWHIECSAMSMRHLGETFDIHCGGVDHISVHHTAEIAQSEAATQKPWVPIWMHSEFMLINAEKMAKSKGKTILIDDFIERGVDPLVFRFICLNSHYRAQLNFTWELVNNAAQTFEKLKSQILALKAQVKAPLTVPTFSGTNMQHSSITEFSDAVRDDLNTPKAFAAVWSVLTDKQLSPDEKLSLLYNFDGVLGFNMYTWSEAALDIPQQVHDLVQQRELARRNKNWGESDSLRKALSDLGFIVQDSPQGPVVKKLRA